MKNIKIILIVAMVAFAFSCKDNSTTPEDKTPTEDKSTIDLIATDGTEIEGSYELGTVSFHTQIKNTGTEAIKVLALMRPLQITKDDTQASYFCWGDLANGTGLCYAPSTEDFLSTFTVGVGAGEITPAGNFINYAVNFNKEQSVIKVRYIVYEDGNEANRDSVDYTITFK